MNLVHFLFPPREIPRRITTEFMAHLRWLVLSRLETPSAVLDQLRTVRRELDTLIGCMEERSKGGAR